MKSVMFVMFRDVSRSGFGNYMLRLCFIFTISIFLLLTPSTYSKSVADRPHADKSKLPKGCWSCHRGHGRPNTPMLAERKEVFCFRCHGHSINVERTMKRGDLASNVKTDNIQIEFEKPYRHPIEKVGMHRTGETMPEKNPSMPRHVECVDCHHHHYVNKENKFEGIKGVTREGISIDRITFEYELCFKCHSYSANLPANQTNKAVLFDISNPSYHPVIAPGKNNNIFSLVPPLTTLSLIKCTDCHNNDDSTGSKGAHGSIYRYILSKNFTQNDGPEGPFQYELCYSCHRRNSIISNEGFPFHNLHISSAGTSCRTCHNPHGSTQYTHLIDLDNPSIRPSSSGRLEFKDFGISAGQCFLNCHGKDHNPAVYPAASPLPSSRPARLR